MYAVVWAPKNAPSVSTLGPVPKGEQWRFRAAGVATTYAGEAEYAMELVTAEGYRIPLARGYRVMGTPALALNRELVVREGESLGARAWFRTATKLEQVIICGAWDVEPLGTK